MFYCVVVLPEARKLLGVGVQNNAVFAFGGKETIIGKRFLSVPVENKNQFSALESHYLVALVVPQLIYIRQVRAVPVFYLLQFLAQQVHHRLVEAVEVGVVEIRVVHQAPLAACVFATPAVALTREINPLGVPELVAHKVEIPAVDGRGSDKAYHLVECDGTIDHIGGVSVLEMPVHIGVRKAEDDGLVTHQCLIVALGV